MEHQEIAVVTICVMNAHTSLYVSVNYSGIINTHLEPFVSYLHSFNPIFKCNLLCTHGTHTINLHFHIVFCERNTHTILLTSVGLTQACPNN